MWLYLSALENIRQQNILQCFYILVLFVLWRWVWGVVNCSTSEYLETKSCRPPLETFSIHHHYDSQIRQHFTVAINGHWSVIHTFRLTWSFFPDGFSRGVNTKATNEGSAARESLALHCMAWCVFLGALRRSENSFASFNHSESLHSFLDVTATGNPSCDWLN